MSDTVWPDGFGDEGGGPDPQRAVRAQAPQRLTRFYTKAGLLEGPDGFTLTLDGRPARTPRKRALAVASLSIAQALEAEWNAQGTTLDPATMLVTRLVNSALDGVATMMDSVAQDAARYARFDCLCYRAEGPQRLVDRQSEHWDCVLDWARDVLGAPFVRAQGIIHVAQPDGTLAAIRRELETIHSPLVLAGVHSMTTLTGSVLLALAVRHGWMSPAQAWTAAHVDEDHQAEFWGADDEAAQRRAGRWAEMQAAALLALQG